MTDLHKYPFSVIASSKHGRCTCEEKRVGDISEEINKEIGKLVIRMKGAVSANNYIEFDGLTLHGRFVYVQLKLLKNMIATLHIELLVAGKTPLRITLSTLYQTPKSVGTILRLPLPARKEWMCIGVDLDAIIDKYSNLSSVDRKPGQRVIKKIQLCSSMDVREVVTSDKPLFGAKDLAMKPNVPCDWLDLLRYLEGLPQATESPEASDVRNKSISTSPFPSPSSPNGAMIYKYPELTESFMSPAGQLFASTQQQQQLSMVASSPISTILHNTVSDQSPQDLMNPPILGEKAVFVPPTPEPAPDSALLSPIKGSTAVGTSTGRGPTNKSATAAAVDFSKLYLRLSSKSTRSTSRNNLKSEHYSTPAESRGDVNVADISTAQPKPPTAVSNSERVLHLGRVMGYQGGPSLLLLEGKLAVFPSGPLIVLVDVEGVSDEMIAGPSPGIWRNFHANSSVKLPILGRARCGDDGFRQAFLRGHARNIALLDLSVSGRMMASCEGGQDAALILWDMKQGKRLATIYPHSESVTAVAFSPDGSLLATCGIDAQHRTQIIVWDIQMLLMDRISALNTTRGLNPTGAIVAKQLSDFHISKLRFLPFDETMLQSSTPSLPASTPLTIPAAASASEPGLVSCGRENIRFWRIRKGHLPGRPVMLNEYSRGYNFTDLAFHSEPAHDLHGPMAPFVFVASSKGVLFKVDPISEKVICSFQLHGGSILSLCVQGGYAVTGSQDNMLRVWPMTFGDFLLEAHHEGPVNCVHVSNSGRKLIVGTAAGTLGVLDVLDHTYNTIVRSHIGAVNCVVSRAPTLDEFITLGRDGTIRVWDTLTAQQKFEFSSPIDEPRGVAYNTVPGIHQVAVGFTSGYVRVFDIPTTTTLYERLQHTAPVVKLVYAPSGNRLYSAGLDGCIAVYDALNHYMAIKTIIAAVAPSVRGTVESSPSMGRRGDEMFEVNNIFIAVNDAGTLLVSSGPNISSLVVYSTEDLVAVMRGGGAAALHSPGTSAIGRSSGTSVKSGAGSRRTRGSAGSASSRRRARSHSIDSSRSVSSHSSRGSRESKHSAGSNRSASLSRLSSSKKTNKSKASLNSTTISVASTPATESAIVSGISFCEDRPGGAILVLTDKNAISLPLDIDNLIRPDPSKPRKKQVSTGGGWSIKKFDFGLAKIAIRDAGSGLLLVPFKFQSQTSPLKAVKKSLSKDIPTEGLALVHTAHKLVRLGGVLKDTRSGEVKSTMQVSLQLSHAQIYQDNNLIVPGSTLVDACMCVQYGRIITVDNFGNIAIWFIDEPRLELFQSSVANAEIRSAKDTASFSSPSHYIHAGAITSPLGAGTADPRVISSSNNPISSVVSSPTAAEISARRSSLSENTHSKIKPIVDDDASETSELSFEGHESTVKGSEKVFTMTRNPVILDSLNTERVIKVDSQRVAILDIIEHNAESETTQEDANILPYPHLYPYTYDSVVENTRVIDISEIEKERKRKMKEMLKSEGLAYVNVDLDAPPEEVEEEPDEIIFVGDEENADEDLPTASAATDAANQGLLTVPAIGEDESDMEAMLRRNTESNKEATNQKRRPSIPIAGLESWVNVFKEAEAEAQAEQKQRLQAMLDEQPEESDSSASFLVGVNTITRELPVYPSLACGNLLLSDGSAVYLNGLSTGRKNEVHLQRPVTPDETSASPSALASVLMTSISPCGGFIAVITWTLDDDVYGVTRAPYSELLVWKLHQPPTPERTTRQVIERVVIETPDPVWVCISVARLYELALSPTGPVPASVLMNQPISSAHSHITWSSDSRLVLVTPIISVPDDEGANKPAVLKRAAINDDDSVLSGISNNSAADDRLLLTLIPSEFLSSLSIDIPHDLTDALRAQGKIISLALSGEELLGLKIMCPSEISATTLPRILIWNNSKVIVLAVDDESSGCGWRECWSEDIGAHGPYIAVDTVLCHSALDAGRRYLLSSLDSNGALRYATLPVEEASLGTAHRKSYIAKMPGGGGAGTLRSMVLTTSSDILMPYNPFFKNPYAILGSSTSVRIYSVEISDENSRNLRNPEHQTIHVTLSPITKFVTGFLPEYIIPFKLSDYSSVNMHKNSICILAADKPGNISFCEVHCEKESLEVATQSVGKFSISLKSSVHRVSMEPNFLPGGKDGGLVVSVPYRYKADGAISGSGEDEMSSSAIIVSQNCGKVTFTHSPSGIKLTPPGTVGFNNCSCLTATSDTIAIGLKSGRIAIHNSISLELWKLIDPLFLYEKIAKKRAGFATKQNALASTDRPTEVSKTVKSAVVDSKKIKNSSSNVKSSDGKIVRSVVDPPAFKAGSVHGKLEDFDNAQADLEMNNSPIESMMFLYDGSILVATRENKSITLYDLRKSGVTVKDYLQMPPLAVDADVPDMDGESTPSYSLHLVGSFSADNIVPESTFAHPSGIWGVLRVFGPHKVEMNIFHTILGEKGSRNGPEDTLAPMRTERLATISLQDEKLSSELARIEREKLARQRMNDESGEQDPAGMSLYDVPSLNVIGAHLSIDIVKDEPDDALSEKEEGNVVSANGKVGLSFKSENGWVGSKPAKRLPLTVTVVALASIIGQPTTWAMVGSLVLDEPNKKKRVPKIRDSGRGKQFQGTKDVLQQKPAVSTSTVFTKRVVGLSKALRLGHLSSFIFHENLLVIASHGGVRVYDLHALLFNRELMVQSLMKARMQQKQSFGPSSSSHVGKSGNLAELASNPDNTEDSNAGEATDQIESDVPIPISMKDVDKLEKMRVCIGALGGMDPENRASTTFGRVNWEGSSIAIAKKYRKNIGTSKSELPDVFVSRAFPPCLIRIVLPPDNLQFENNFDDSASIDSD